MHIVIISEYFSSERFIIEKIRQKFPRTTVIVPDYSLEKKPDSSITFAPKRFIGSWIQRVYDKLYRRKSGRKLFIEKLKHGDSTSSNFLSVRLHTLAGIQTLQKLAPDVLITCSAPIIKDELIQIAKISAFNIHFGVAPFYRGNNTLFWTLYFDDFEKIGGCIHHLSKGVDAGNLIVEVYPTLIPSDRELEIEVKVTKLLAEAAINLLHHLKETGHSPVGKIQPDGGRNFKRKERTLGKLSFLLYKQFLGKSAVPNRASRVIHHY